MAEAWEEPRLLWHHDREAVLRSGYGSMRPRLGSRGLAERGHASKMVSIGLYTGIIGRPARLGGLTSLRVHMQRKGQVWFARREDIARYWREQLPLPFPMCLATARA
jgi:hypothetical protein